IRARASPRARSPCERTSEVARFARAPRKIGKRPLLFVRRGSILVQRGNAIPSHSRRPPWAFPPLTWAAGTAGGPIFFLAHGPPIRSGKGRCLPNGMLQCKIGCQGLFGRCPVGSELLARQGRQPPSELDEVGSQPRKGGRAFVA